MIRSLEQELIPRAEEFLIKTAKDVIIPDLKKVYEDGLGSLIVKAKNAKTFEPTTSADRKIDNKVRELWQKKFSDVPWYSEDSKDKRVKGMTPEQLQNLPALFVPDMVDGSGRLAAHSDRFSSSLALVIKGRPVLAVICHPVSGTIWTASELREGAFKNGEQIHVSGVDKLDRAMISTAFAWNLKDRDENQKILNRLVPFVNQVVGTASSVLDITDVAQGQTHAHISFGLMPWDKAGAAHLVDKAGGEVISFKKIGQLWTPFLPDILACNNERISKEIIELLYKNAIAYAIIKMLRMKTRGPVNKEIGIIATINGAKRGVEKAVTIFRRKGDDGK